MSLNFPYNGSRKIAQNNLDKLFGLGTTTKPELNDILTPVAKDALQDHLSAQLGFSHQIKKGCASVVGFAAPVVGIVSTGVASVYFYLNHLDKIHSAKPSLDNHPLINVAANVAGVVGPVLLVDLALQKAVNRSPLSALTKWSISMLSAVGLFASYKASEAVASKYVKMEKAAHETSIAAQRCLFEQEIAVFNSIADELDETYREAVKTPKKVYRLKQLVSHLQTKVALAEKLLRKTPLAPSEISHITDKLKSTIRGIREVPFSLATSFSTVDTEYNLRLITALSHQEFASIAIPRSAMHHTYLVKDNTYGEIHRIKSAAYAVFHSGCVALAIGGGVAAAAAVATVVGKVYEIPRFTACYQNQMNCVEAHVVTGVAAVGALFSGYQAFITQLHLIEKDHVRAKKAVADHTKETQTILKRVYVDIANLLIDLNNHPEKVKGGMETIRSLAENVKSKLSGIDNAVEKLGILPDPSSITDGLHQTVNRILES